MNAAPKATHTPGPWRVMSADYSGECHYMVVDRSGVALFDTVNRSPAAETECELKDIQLAASAPNLLNALLAAKPILCRIAASAGTKRAQEAYNALRLMDEWEELFP